MMPKFTMTKVISLVSIIVVGVGSAIRFRRNHNHELHGQFTVVHQRFHGTGPHSQQMDGLG